MSVMRVSRGVNKKIVKAKESRPFKIYKKSFAPGKMVIDINMPAPKKSTMIIVFYGTDPTGPKELSCGGDQKDVSDIKGEYYRMC